MPGGTDLAPVRLYLFREGTLSTRIERYVAKTPDRSFTPKRRRLDEVPGERRACLRRAELSADVYGCRVLGVLTAGLGGPSGAPPAGIGDLAARLATRGRYAPIRIGAIAVRDRIAMAPLTRACAGMHGVHSPLAIEYYACVISEATNISRQGRGYAFTPGIYTDAQVEAWKPDSRPSMARGAGSWSSSGMWVACHTPAPGEWRVTVAPSAIRAGERTYIETGIAEQCPLRSGLKRSRVSHRGL